MDRKKREANFELLRIAAMLMIITLHYLDKGGILPGPASEFSLTGYMAWGLEALCVPAVNAYVLLSACFLADSDYRPLKAVKLWIQVFFYSAGIGMAALLMGIVPAADFDKYQAMNWLFPAAEEHYWFVTAYLLMYLLAPLMNETLRKLPKKTLEQGIFLLLVLLCFCCSILPVRLPVDRLGYDALWFLCLYLIGADLRYHRPAQRSTKKACRAMAFWLLCCGLIYASLLFVHAFYLRTGSLGDFINRQYQYNSILCLPASIFLFDAFRNLRIPEGRLRTVICGAASASFGVYLIHEHMYLRYLWPKWLETEKYADTPWFLLHWAVSTVAVYTVCMCIDFIRQAVFNIAGRRWYLHSLPKL